MKRIRFPLFLLGFAFLAAQTIFLACLPAASAEIHIYIDQAGGANTSGTAGTEGDPFKSITYALLTMDGRGAADPWVVHVKAGVYDADPAKPAGEREIFPIELREGMTLQGDDGAGSCIISGSFNADSQVALVYGENLSGITIVGLALQP